MLQSWPLLFVLTINILPMAWVDKFSFQMAMGLAVFFLAVASKATRNEYKNLSVLLFGVALSMVVIAIVFTSELTLIASSLEDMSNPLIAGFSGMFADVEDKT